MQIYRLTDEGERRVHSYRAPRIPAWNVLHYLNRHGGVATKEQILENVPDSTSMTLFKLSRSGLISSSRRVEVENGRW